MESLSTGISASSRGTGSDSTQCLYTACSVRQFPSSTFVVCVCYTILTHSRKRVYFQNKSLWQSVIKATQVMSVPCLQGNNTVCMYVYIFICQICFLMFVEQVFQQLVSNELSSLTASSPPTLMSLSFSQRDHLPHKMFAVLKSVC